MNLKFSLLLALLAISTWLKPKVEANTGLDAIKKHFEYAKSHLSGYQMENINDLKAEISDASGNELDYPFIVVSDEALEKGIAKFLLHKKGLYSDESSDENGLAKFRADYNKLIASTCETIKLDYLVTSTVYQLEAKSDVKFLETITNKSPELSNWIQNAGLCLMLSRQSNLHELIDRAYDTVILYDYSQLNKI